MLSYSNIYVLLIVTKLYPSVVLETAVGFVIESSIVTSLFVPVAPTIIPEPKVLITS